MGLAALRVTTIDAHVGGAALRLVVDGFPAPRGRTMAERAAWAGRHAEGLRLAVLREPRGHADMTGAVFVEPVSPDSDAALLVMGRDGFEGFRGHDLVAALTIALERGILVPRTPEAFVVDTVAGRVEIRPALRVPPEGGPPRVVSVAYRPPPCAVAGAAIPVEVSGRRVRVDVSWAAGWYAVVDREALGVPSQSAALESVRRAGLATVDALEPQTRRWRVPGGGAGALAGVVLTSPPARDDADLRSTTVYADGTVDRSPSGSGTCAVLAVLDAMGLVGSRPVRHEGPSGLVFEARIVERLAAGEPPAILAEVSASAWITGEHVFLLDPADPFVDGFQL